MNINFERNIPIDALRGFAIFLMVISNSYDYIFNDNPNISLRFLVSSAAPIFVFLSGYNFQLSIEKNKSTSEIFKRIFQIFIVAIFIDVIIWRIFPMQNFDVLYLISISMIGMFFLKFFSINLKIGIMLIVIIISFFFSFLFNYRFQITELELNIINFKLLSRFYGTDFIKRIFIDGWFPIFPWFSIALLGNVVKQKSDFIKKYSQVFGVFGILIVLLSTYIFINNDNNIYLSRNGYIEIFYPFNFQFSIYLIGFLGIILFVINLKSISFFSKLQFQVVGKYSLYFYLYHSIIIGFVFKYFFKEHLKNNFIYGILALALFWTSIVLLSLFLDKNKTKFGNSSLMKKLFFITGIS